MPFGDEKKRIWFMDQYCHPHTKTFSVGDVLRWFKENGVEYVNSLPKINPGERLTSAERLFACSCGFFAAAPAGPRGPGGTMIAKVRARLLIATELLSFLWAVRLWWLIPMVLILLASSVMLILAYSSSLAPFIYAVF